jgi:diguanylate cyclase (GGDEF)-like protein
MDPAYASVMRTTPLLRLLGWIDDSPLWFRWLLPFVLTAVVGTADVTTNADVAFTLAYLLPVALAAWHLGLLASLIIAAISTSTSLAVDLHTLPKIPHPAILTINLVAQMLVFGFFGLILSRLRRHLEREHGLATTDPLTGLANRRALWANTEHEMQRCRRSGNPYSLAYLDVDGFKGVNDRYGHRSGDEVLVEIAKTLLDNVRAVDCVARMGGDEFALLLPDTGEEGARTVIDKLRSHLATAAWNRKHQVSFSIGALTVTDPAAEVDSIIAHADKLMYAVKAAGKDGQRHEVMAARQPHSTATRN